VGEGYAAGGTPAGEDASATLGKVLSADWFGAVRWIPPALLQKAPPPPPPKPPPLKPPPPKPPPPLKPEPLELALGAETKTWCMSVAMLCIELEKNSGLNPT
jgi:hypothetical protein